MATNTGPRTCGKMFIPKLGKKINIHAKKGESCEDARKRVAAKWAADPTPETPSKETDEDRGTESSSG